MLQLSHKLLAISLLVILFFTSSCGEINRPFKPENKSLPSFKDTSILKNSIITVSPTSGIKIEKANLLADLVTKALLQEGILASRQSEKLNSLILRSRLQKNTIFWSLIKPEGILIYEIEMIYSDTQLLKHTQTVAELISRAINSIDRISVNQKAQVYLAVLPIDGALKPGASTLFREMVKKIDSPQIIITNDLIKARFLLAGSIYLEEKDDQLQLVVIEWTIMNTNGAKIGTVTQQNWMPINKTENQLSIMAETIVNKAVRAIKPLLESTY